MVFGCCTHVLFLGQMVSPVAWESRAAHETEGPVGVTQPAQRCDPSTFVDSGVFQCPLLYLASDQVEAEQRSSTFLLATRIKRA